MTAALVREGVEIGGEYIFGTCGRLLEMLGCHIFYGSLWPPCIIRRFLQFQSKSASDDINDEAPHSRSNCEVTCHELYRYTAGNGG